MLPCSPNMTMPSKLTTIASCRACGFPTYHDAVFGKFGMTKTDGIAIIGGIFSNVKDFKSEVVGLHGNDEFAALEWQSSGILTAEHELLPKVAIGQTIRAVGVGLYEIKNQKVVREST
jgi:hypothetical protein